MLRRHWSNMEEMLIGLLAFPPGLAALVADLVVLALATVIATVAHRLIHALLVRVAARTKNGADDLIVARVREPARWMFLLVALGMVQPALHLPEWAARLWIQITGFAIPGLIGWLAIALVRATSDILSARHDLTAEDNLEARRRQTRLVILVRIAIFLILFLSICMMLLSIPGVRNVGVTLIASAGLAGLAVGAAAQPALKNLIAGIQLAFTEPIRIDDVLIVEGEWGRVEEIRLTYVVVRIWDDRRLIVPVSKFLEESFQNWTRSTSALMGSVILHLDPATDFARLRAKAGEIIEANPRWDRRFWNLQVTDSAPDAVQVRVLVTARDAGRAFDLRCDVREALLTFIAQEMPEAFPRRRQLPAGALDIRSVSDEVVDA